MNSRENVHGESAILKAAHLWAEEDDECGITSGFLDEISCDAGKRLKVNGRLVGTRTPDLHRVNSKVADARRRMAKHRTAPKNKT
jgi:hypothetical protein